MQNRILSLAATTMLCSILGMGAGGAQADVTIQRSTAIEGVGVMAFGNMTGTSTTVISGNRSRTDTDSKMQSKLVGFLARNAVGPTAEIVSLDEDRIDHLNLNKKEYTETTFEQLRAQMQKATDRMNSQQQQPQQGGQPSAVDQSKCEWLPAKVTVNRTGEKAQYAGYDSERAIVTAVQPCQDKETGSVCDVVLVLDQWLSPDLTENAEVRRYYQAYAAKMGLDAASMQDVAQRAKAMFGQYKGLWSEVATKMQGLKGYPVRTGFTLALGGEKCKDSKAQQGQSGQTSDDSGGSGVPTSAGALAGALAGKFGGMFHKKQDDTGAAPASASAPAVSPVPLPPGEVALMTVTSQLLGISNSSVSADLFTVPADFKKTELRTQ